MYTILKNKNKKDNIKVSIIVKREIKFLNLFYYFYILLYIKFFKNKWGKNISFKY